jgi:hypothetical protein
MLVLTRLLLAVLPLALGNAAPSPRMRRACEGAAAKAYRFCDPTLPADVRAKDIVRRLELSEKPALMTARHSAPVDRLGIPSYDWGVNSIHGDQVSCGTNCATNYPLPVAIGATLNMTLVYELANMMGVELRALRLEGACEQHRRLQSATFQEEGPPPPPEGDACIGLDTWAPNLNLNRDPRCARARGGNGPCSALTTAPLPPQVGPELGSRNRMPVARWAHRDSIRAGLSDRQGRGRRKVFAGCDHFEALGRIHR